MHTLPDKVYCAPTPFVGVKDQEAVAMKAGRPARDIYVEGRGAETLAACLAAIRGPGTLGLVGGLRVLGDSRKAVMANVRLLRERQITPYNLQTGVDDQAELLDEAVAKIAGARQLRNDKRAPKRLGRKGGLTKGIMAQHRRDSILPEEIVKRLCAHPALTWPDCAKILGLPWSESTLRRKYGA